MLTETGREIAGRATRILAETRDIVDFARRQGNLLSGPLHFGVIPSVAPYVLPALLPLIRDRFPDLDLHLRETQTHHLLGELLDGALDLLLLALPVENPEIETIKLFNDRFLLAMPKSRSIPNRIRATPDLLRQDRLLLLEEGHCLREQALSFCNLRRADNIDTFGASNLPAAYVSPRQHSIGTLCTGWTNNSIQRRMARQPGGCIYSAAGSAGSTIDGPEPDSTRVRFNGFGDGCIAEQQSYRNLGEPRDAGASAAGGRCASGSAGARAMGRLVGGQHQSGSSP